MPRIVALDVGDATIGVAATDELRLIASPVRTIHRTRSVKADLSAVEEMLRELDACLVVIGLPLDAEGEEGIQARKVKNFSNRLARRVTVPIEFWDERFSTADAEERLLETDMSRAKRRERIHAAAAAIVLESYLRERLNNVG
ncbi:MAG: Holliday junction resolvase RuvX [Armatimonadetes bacterium]|nr:Holliday junction resolvase RuvX [Armatimonadota bacterium]